MPTETAREEIHAVAVAFGWTVFRPFGYRSARDTLPTVEYRQGDRYLHLAFTHADAVAAGSYGRRAVGRNLPVRMKREAALEVLRAESNRAAREAVDTIAAYVARSTP